MEVLSDAGSCHTSLRKIRFDRRVRTSAAKAALIPRAYGAPEGAPFQGEDDQGEGDQGEN
jgi:hypothetical protein